MDDDVLSTCPYSCYLKSSMILIRQPLKRHTEGQTAFSSFPLLLIACSSCTTSTFTRYISSSLHLVIHLKLCSQSLRATYQNRRSILYYHYLITASLCPRFFLSRSILILDTIVSSTRNCDKDETKWKNSLQQPQTN